MKNNDLFSLRRNAAIIGGWLFGIYALVAEVINRLALPNIPLAEPSGGLLLQILVYVAIGALLGLICTLPSSSLFGSVLGGAAGAVCIMLFNFIGALDSQNFLGGMAMITLIAILPTTLLLTPVSWAVRYAAEALTPTDYRESAHPNWKRTIIISAVFMIIGVTALYPAYVRDALTRTNQMVQNAVAEGKVSPALEKVWGFPEGAQGSYQIEWSDDWQSYSGTYAASLDQLSAFLVRVKFDNGFVIYCLASSTTQPVCLNENAPFGQ